MRNLYFIIVFTLTLNTKLFCQGNSNCQIFVAKRIGYYKATLTISKDSIYKYSESNHKGQQINETGKFFFLNGEYYLNSSTKKITKSNKNKKTCNSIYKFSMQKINYNANKIVIIPCDSIFPEYCTFIRTEK